MIASGVVGITPRSAGRATPELVTGPWQAPTNGLGKRALKRDHQFARPTLWSTRTSLSPTLALSTFSTSPATMSAHSHIEKIDKEREYVSANSPPQHVYPAGQSPFYRKLGDPGPL